MLRQGHQDPVRTARTGARRLRIGLVEAASEDAWSCPWDTHNVLRSAVETLSGKLLHTIYAADRQNVRSLAMKQVDRARAYELAELGLPWRLGRTERIG